MLKTFFAELKSRNVRKTMAIYIGSALTTIGVIKLFIETYAADLSASVMPVVVTILAFGFVSAFVFAWVHGKEGAQKFSWREILFHVVIAAFALVISFRIEPSRTAQRLRKGAHTIAVLPFKNMSGNNEDEYFSDGFTEDILTQLSKVGELCVISRSSVMKYKQSQMSPPEIAHELGASVILNGSVRRIGNRVRIDGKLSNAASDEILWAETYDRELKDVFAIQTEVARKIAQELRAKLSPEEQRLIEKRATSSTDAYDYYLAGRNYYNKTTKDDNERAITLFKKAIARDPLYVQAQAGVADAYSQRFQRYGFEERWLDSSIALCRFAIEIDPNVAEPYKSLGLAYYLREWYQRAAEQYRKALALNPNYASVYGNIGELLDWTGHQDEAIANIRKAIKLEPGRVTHLAKLAGVFASVGMDSASDALSRRVIELQPALSTPYTNRTELSMRQGTYDEARKILQQILLTNQDEPAVLKLAGDVELFDGKYDQARTWYERGYSLSPDAQGVAVSLGFVFLKMGKRRNAEEMLDRSIRINKGQIQAGSEEGLRRYELACAYALRGENASALRWLRESIERGGGVFRLTEKDPLLENLRSTSEFQELIAMIDRRTAIMQERVRAFEELQTRDN